MTRRLGWLAAAAPGLAPEAAWACAVCVDSAWGNRGFGWPYVVLMVAPFAVAAAIAVGVVLVCRRPPEVRRGGAGSGG
jgi:hypothetical protein